MSLFHQLCAERDIIPLGLMKAQEDPHYGRFKKWIAEGQHGSMRYLENYPAIRANPARLQPDMDQVWVCGFPYGEKQGSSKRKASSASPSLVAQYGVYQDYHRFLRRLGSEVMELYITQTHQNQARYRVVVDSAPIMEKSLALQTGAGFMGKNTLFILPGRGSLLFLFEIFTSASFESASFSPGAESSQKASCGSCRRCQVHCPTGALDEDYVLDARKCLAYYTIEHRWVIPVRYWSYLREYYFGCDVCQLVCPYNRHAQASRLLRRHVPQGLPLHEIATMDQRLYEQWFGGTPMTRSKRFGLRRNALIALYVKGDAHFPAVEKHVQQEQHPLLLATLDQRSEYDAYLGRV